MLHEELAEKVIACAMEVHRELGPGLLESSYQACMRIELTSAGLKWIREIAVPIGTRE